VLVSKILGHLDEWTTKEPDKFKKFYQNFGPIFKIGINTDFTNRDKIIELLRFESTTTEENEYTSLKNYVSRMQSNQKEIYYLSSENKDTIRRNPNLEYFKKNDL
jgi:molecular chaperone HtpG